MLQQGAWAIVMYRHLTFKLTDQTLATANIQSPPPNFVHFTTDPTYLQSLLLITDPKQLGHGSTGRIYKAVLKDLRSLRCVVKLHKDLIDNERYMSIQFPLGEKEGGKLVMHTAPSPHLFEAVSHEFRLEVDFSIRLTLGPSVCRLHLTSKGVQPVYMGLWTQVQQDMQAQKSKPGYNHIHHILEFDLYTVPCIISGQCDGDLLHLAQKEQLPDALRFQIWQNLLAQVLAGVRFMHRDHIAHNDLKPGNLFYNRQLSAFHAFVADFGMCTAAETPIFVDFGTEQYASPEVRPTLIQMKQHAAAASAANTAQHQSSKTALSSQAPKRLSVPMHNDAYSFAKTGLMLWALFQQPQARELDLVPSVDALISAPQAKTPIMVNPLHQRLLAICRAPSGAERYAAFQALTIE